MSGTKLSPHILAWNADILDFIERTKPAIIKIVQPFGYNPYYINEAKRLSPNSLWLLRLYVDEQPLDSPKQNARDFANKIWSYIAGMDIFEGYNEPWPFGEDQWKRINGFETELAFIVHSWGKQYICGCWSNGQPPIGAWQYLKDSLEVADYLSLHSYGWPTLSDTSGLALRHRQIWELLPVKKPIILSEVGMTGAVFGGADEGWRKWSWPTALKKQEDRAAEQWAWLLDRLNEDSQVVAANMYTTGRQAGDAWATHDFTKRLYQLVGDYIMGHPSPEPIPEPSGIIQALDVSEWQGPIEESQWREAYAAGYRMAIVQAWGGGPVKGGRNAYCAQQLAGARKAGLTTAIYIFIPSDTTTLTHFLIQAGKDAAGAEYEYVKFVALDIEGDELLHPTDPCGRLANAVSNVKDKPVVIYSSLNMWGICMRNDACFQHLPLWDARYDNIPELDTNWVPYGGWEKRAGKQYKGTTTVPGGFSADLNVVDLGRLFGA